MNGQAWNGGWACMISLGNLDFRHWHKCNRQHSQQGCTVLNSGPIPDMVEHILGILVSE